MVGVIVVLLGASVVVLRSGIGGGQTGSAITEQWVEQKLVDWKPDSISPMNFGAHFARASYDNILTAYNTIDVQNADLTMLMNTNALFIRIDVGYDAWLQNDVPAQQEMASLIGVIRNDGRSLIIADGAAESYRHGGQIPWSQFQQAWVQRVKTLASLFHPDYYIVIKEPGWYVPMISDVLTDPVARDPNSWLNLTRTLASAVLAASPNTRIGISIAADSLSSDPSLYVPYLTGLSGITSVSFIGFDIYTTTGFDSTQAFLNNYGSQGKEVWIAECWSGDGSQIFSSTRATLDANWIKVLYYFGQRVHASMVIPFYTDLFASYSLTGTSPSDSSQIVSLYQQRTPVFDSYRAIIQAGGANAT